MKQSGCCRANAYIRAPSAELVNYRRGGRRCRPHLGSTRTWRPLTAPSLGRRPVAQRPDALVDAVDLLLHVVIAAEPGEVVPVTHLELHLRPLRLPRTLPQEAQVTRRLHGHDVPDGPVVNPLDRFADHRVVAPTEPRHDAQVLLLGQFAGRHHASHARRIDAHRLLREDVFVGLNGRSQMQWAKLRRRGQQHHVDSRWRSIPCRNRSRRSTSPGPRRPDRDASSSSCLRCRLHPIGESVGHGHQTHARIGVDRIRSGPGSPTAAANQTDLQNVAAGRIGATLDGQNAAADGSRGLQKLSTRNAHGVLPEVWRVGNDCSFDTGGPLHKRCLHACPPKAAKRRLAATPHGHCPMPESGRIGLPKRCALAKGYLPRRRTPHRLRRFSHRPRPEVNERMRKKGKSLRHRRPPWYDEWSHENDGGPWKPVVSRTNLPGPGGCGERRGKIEKSSRITPQDVNRRGHSARCRTGRYGHGLGTSPGPRGRQLQPTRPLVLVDQVGRTRIHPCGLPPGWSGDGIIARIGTYAAAPTRACGRRACRQYFGHRTAGRGFPSRGHRSAGGRASGRRAPVGPRIRPFCLLRTGTPLLRRASLWWLRRSGCRPFATTALSNGTTFDSGAGARTGLDDASNEASLAGSRNSPSRWRSLPGLPSWDAS